MTWTASDLTSYVGISSPTAAETAFATSVLEVSYERLGALVVDTTLSTFEHAVLMTAARLWKRKSSPEGVLQFGDFFNDIKSWDPDIEALLAGNRRWKFGQ